MQQYFDFELCGLKRSLPFVEVADNLWLASFVCLSDTELVTAAAPELVKRLPPVDCLMTAEAKGIALAYEMSRMMGFKAFIVARKSRKLYMQNAMDDRYPTLARPVELVAERYNQHLSEGMMILEVGSSGNTLREALQASDLFGETVGPALGKLLTDGD